MVTLLQTSRERPNLAPYLRLKKAELQSSKYSLLQYQKNQKLDRIGAPGGPFGDFFEKSLTMPKN